VGCRECADRSVLLRVVAAEVDGVLSVVPDPGRRRAGRGASVHLDPRCLDLAERRKAFPRALRRSGTLDLEPVRRFVVAAATQIDDWPTGESSTSTVRQHRPSRKRV
jgi:hypothetical protein